MKIIRLILIILLVLALVAGFGYLALQSGTITYNDGIRSITTSPLIAVASLLLAVIILMVVIGFLGWLIALPAKISRANLENNRKKSIEFMGAAFAAYESGDYLESRRVAQKAYNLSPKSPPLQLMNARFSFAAEDYSAAEKLFGELTEVAGYEVAARKGLAEIAQKNSNFAAAISHAETALQVSKKATWPIEMIFKERVINGDWEGALTTLDNAEKRGLIGKQTLARRRAVVLTAAAHRAEKGGDLAKALEYSTRAVKLSSSFAPAAVMAARLQNMSGKTWAAASTIEQAWEREPHPALALAYRDLKANEPKEVVARWAEALVRLKPEHRESKILQAEDAIAAGDAATAGIILDRLLQDKATSRLWALKAQVAQLLKDSAKFDEFMHKAAASPREPDWSDLDPDGVAFAYEDEDWARMVESYGDKGQLIHPRLERLQPSKALKSIADDVPPAIISAPEQEITPPAADGVEAFSHLGEDIDEGKKKNWLGI